MLDSILRAAGLRSVAAGNVGLPLTEAVMDPEPYDVIAVELSSFQLHYVSTDGGRVGRRPELRRGPPRLVRRRVRHGRLRRATRAASTKASSGPASTTSPTRRPSGSSATPTSSRGRGRSASPSASPSVGMVGVVEDILVDRAFIDERQSSAAELCAISDLASPAPALRRQRPRRRGTGAGARHQPGRRTRRPAGVPPGRPPHRRGRRARRRHLGRRLQGDQPARRTVLAGGLRPGGVGGRRPGEGRDLRRARAAGRAAGCGASYSSDATARSSRRRLRDTRRMSR